MLVKVPALMNFMNIYRKKRSSFVIIFVRNTSRTNLCEKELGPLLLAWINFNHSLEKKFHPLQKIGRNYLSIPKLQRVHFWSLGMDKLFHPILYWAYDYLTILESNSSGFEMLVWTNKSRRHDE